MQGDASAPAVGRIRLALTPNNEPAWAHRGYSPIPQENAVPPVSGGAAMKFVISTNTPDGPLSYQTVSPKIALARAQALAERC